MLKHTFTAIRSSVSVPWFELPSELVARRTELYITPGKIHSREESVSEDGLLKTVVTVFTSGATFQEFVEDEHFRQMFSVRDKYNATHAIETSAILEDVE